MKKVIYFFISGFVYFAPVSLAEEANYNFGGEIIVNHLNYEPRSVCVEQKEISRLGKDSNIVIKNGKGEIIGISQIKTLSLPLEEVSPSENSSTEELSDNPMYICKLELQSTQLPKSDFYTFDFGYNRSFTYTFQQMQEQDWKLDLFIDNRGNFL